ncbi:hypothetical protein PM082_008793 [Marasmius tenuissimus]|nr:hypothetical protein PM082_008793 [Marasmius tenuissimus]
MNNLSSKQIVVRSRGFQRHTLPLIASTDQRIDRGAFRLGIATTANGKEAYGYRHWGCIKPEELLEIQKLDLGEVSKYDELHEDDKIRLSKAVEAGHISEEDRLDQTAKSNKAAEELKELKEGKGKEKQDETEKRERKKSKKRKEIEDEADKAAGKSLQTPVTRRHF